MYRKEYSELTFTDDFMFCKVLSTNKDLCKELLELILGIQIRDITIAEEQKSFQTTYDGRGIRLDVYVVSDEDVVYDVEMQTVIKIGLPKRTRYYQGMIDLNLIEKGARFDALKKSFVIFICLDDPFGRNLPVYTFENRCREDNTLVLGDEAVKVMVNARGDRSGLSQEMVDLLDYLLEQIPKSDLTKRIQDVVDRAIIHKEWSVDYMTMQMMLQEERDEGREEGLKEGRNTIDTLLHELVQSGKITEEEARERGEKAKEKLSQP